MLVCGIYFIMHACLINRFLGKKGKDVEFGKQ